MTELQKYLRENSLEKLQDEYSIIVTKHHHQPLCNLKYSPRSPKTHPITMECRGIVLEERSWEVIARPFKRFFNVGEHEQYGRKFDWNFFECREKVDGSLIILYYYKNKWRVNTSGSFGQGKCYESGKTWEELFWDTAHLDTAKLVGSQTYLFELCTSYNVVVRHYPKPIVYLLGVVDTQSGKELREYEVDRVAKELGAARPLPLDLKTRAQIQDFIRDKEINDPTFEGVIIRDNDSRWKIKSLSYMDLHHRLDNRNLFNWKNLIPIVLKDETSEVLTAYPQCATLLGEIKKALDDELDDLRRVFEETKEIENQREFAETVLTRTIFSGILFVLRKQNKKDMADLENLWRVSDKIIINNWKRICENQACTA